MPGSGGLNHDEKLFNSCLAQVRIASEHCIGILKGRFGCIKRNNVQLKKGKKELKHLVRMIGACMVLHNLLINYEDEEIPQEWYDDVAQNIDWTLYDEEEQGIAGLNKQDANRRQFVFDSIISNYL
jgi:hypothetical protein